MVARTQWSLAACLLLAVAAVPAAQAAVSSSFKVGIVITGTCRAGADGHSIGDQRPGPADKNHCRLPRPRVEIEDAPRPAISGAAALDARTRVQTITF